MANPCDYSTLLPDAALLKLLCKQVCDTDTTLAESACETLLTKLDAYLELSTLLDPVLADLVKPLCSEVAKRLNIFTQSIVNSSKHTARRSVEIPSRALYTILKVRGVKPVARHLPHDVADLQHLAEAILFVERNCRRERFWEVRYVLFEWAAVAAAIPFPLSSVLKDAVTEQLITCTQAALSDRGRVSAGAARLLSRLLSRRDTTAYRERLMKKCVEEVLHPDSAQAVRTGTLYFLAALFKQAQREDLRATVPSILAAVESVASDRDDSEVNGTGAVTTGDAHLAVKLAQRVALILLPPRVASWRYSRGTRVLFVPSMKSSAAKGTATNVDDMQPSTEEELDDELDDEGAERLERVIEILLNGLQHRDTVVRWSAAKGVGRVTARLPHDLAQDVIDAVIELVVNPSAARADAGWHGACLALAELARRGLILPTTPQFHAVFAVIRKAAAFDVRRGANSVGAHVRDAACYGVWAVARAYAKEDVAQFAGTITDCMLPVALLDREVNCRRAAAAALQECVGRLSTELFEEGIRLITLADYFSLGDRNAAYLSIAPEVASLAGGTHFNCILHEVWTRKLIHWDSSVRALAAKALATLLPVDKENVITSTVIPKLVHMSTQRGDAVFRHGAVVGIAELAKVVGNKGLESSSEEIRDIPRVLKERKFLTGRTGDEMRIACCHLIRSLAIGVGEVYLGSTKGRMDAEYALEFLESILGCGKENMYAEATEAYTAICTSVIANDIGWHNTVTKRILKGISHGKLFERQRGFALAAGACGDSEVANDVADVLSREIVRSKDVEVRRNSATSLGRLPLRVLRERIVDVLNALSAGMNDYATDERGDIGSWVREGSMRASMRVIQSLYAGEDTAAANHINGMTADALLGVLRRIIEQCCGRIDRTRGVAGDALNAFCKVFVRHAEHKTLTPLCRTLADLFVLFIGEEEGDLRDGVNFLDCASVFPVARKALEVPDISDAVMLGFVSAGGGMGHQSKSAISSLVLYFRDVRDVSKKSDALRKIAGIIESDHERLTVPALHVIEALTMYEAITDVETTVLRDVVRVIRSSWRQRLRDVNRTASAAQALGELATMSMFECSFDFRKDTLGRDCLEALVVVLGGSIPRLRRIAAECIYMVLLGYDEDHDEALQKVGMVPMSCVQQASDIIADSEWELMSLIASRERRNEMCRLLDIRVPAVVKTASARRSATAK